MLQKEKGQMAVEYLTTYVYVFIVIIIAISALLLYLTYPRTIIPTQCSFYSGFQCIDAALSQNSVVGGSSFVVLASDEQMGIVNVSSFNVSIGGIKSRGGSCTPQRVSAGQRITCTANMSIALTPQAEYSGIFNIYAAYCTAGATNLSSISCPASGNFVYSGSFRTQAISVTR
ncbi:MAG: hypothetical protein LVQ95_02035 [Candidatus Micrarchaeales archaeon]|nr:hypothetical protein [Candidatus Micrarchaeales archaeon]